MCLDRLLTIALFSGLLLACEPATEHDTPIEKPTPEQPTPEPEPEEPVFPENPLSTLEGDVEVVFSADNSLSYADCFGNYYYTDSYMWGLYFQNYTSKEQMYVEIMSADHLYEMPLGVYVASDDIYETDIMLKGGFDDDGYQAYSWYTRLETDAQSAATAPIFAGSVAIEEAGEELYMVTFDMMDDKGNKITGVYEGRMVLEDFRIN